MVNRIILILLFIGPIVADNSNSDSTDSRPSLAILDFEIQGSGLSKIEAEGLTNALKTEIIDLKQFIVLERSAINKVFSEQKFQYSGAVDNNTASEIGRIVGAEYVHIGSIMLFAGTYRVDSRLVEVSTGKANISADFESDGRKGLLKGMESIAHKLSGLNYNDTAEETQKAKEEEAAAKKAKEEEAAAKKAKEEALDELVPVYRFYHKNNKDHFYTKNSNPKGDWKHQGIEFYAYPSQNEGTVPIYRFYHKNNKDHFYTKNSNPKGDWKHQGIEFYAYPIDFAKKKRIFQSFE